MAAGIATRTWTSWPTNRPPLAAVQRAAGRVGTETAQWTKTLTAAAMTCAASAAMVSMARIGMGMGEARARIGAVGAAVSSVIAG